MVIGCRGRAHKPEGFGSYQTRNDGRNICRPYKSALIDYGFSAMSHQQ